MAEGIDLAAMERERKAATDAIATSEAPKRLVIAGPGTGKTFAFKEALEKAILDAGEGKGLALTFIRNLVADLKNHLDGVAEVNTFHGYCKYLMHQHVVGLEGADLYPLLCELLVGDLAVTGRRRTTSAEVEEHLHRLALEDGLIAEVLGAADYYNAVSFPDLVYRVLEYFRENPEDVPEYPLVVVDEYQDFCALETTFIELLATKNPVLVAGDDDQALYSDLRDASPEFIRELAARDEYTRFELPYCSRCTDVVVAAVNDVIGAAVADGHLVDRLEKPFVCYLPEKHSDSETNPKLIYVNCSTANMPYAGRYIAQQIAKIPAADIAVSRAEGYPTALVIGPNPFLRDAFEPVKERFPRARMKVREKLVIDPLDGYLRISADERSRLGWRIVASCTPPDAWKETLKEALDRSVDLIDLLPREYVELHERIASLLASVIDQNELSPDDEEVLCAAVDRSLEEIRRHLELDPVDDEIDVEEGGDGDEGSNMPDVQFTTLVGAKGLSAEHVFIVGLNNGHLPRNASAIDDDEISGFLVGLSRTRKRCHLISYRFFFNHGLRKSVFLDWVSKHLDELSVDKDYDFDS
jgi:ATP-dependent DNA helicase UvrD/PcrA